MQTSKDFNVVSLFIEKAILYEKKIAIIEKEKSISFGELAKEVAVLAEKFRSKGIDKDDRVMVFVPMSIDLYRTILGLMYIGAIPVFMDEWSSRARLNHAAKIAKCKAYISGCKGIAFAMCIRELWKIPIKTMPSIDPRLRPLHDSIDRQSNDVAIITLSTGSTGLPKAAIRTHGMLYHQFIALQDYVLDDVNSTDMTALPIVLLVNLGLGKTSIIPDTNLRKLTKMNPLDVYKQIAKYQVTSISSSPFFMQKLANYYLENNRFCNCVKRIIIGGGPCYPSQVEHIMAAFPDAEVKIVYGSTEAEPISSIDGSDLINSCDGQPSNGLKVGEIHPLSNVKIIDIMDEPITFESEAALDKIKKPINHIGEIIVQGPHVVKNYLCINDGEASNKIYLPSSFWHRTGDSGYIDEYNILYLTGRCPTLIYLNGSTISPFVYESQFTNHYEIVIGTVMLVNNKLTAVIEVEKSTDKHEFSNKLKLQYPLIDSVQYVDEMSRDPRHHTKIDYEKLRKKFQII